MEDIASRFAFGTILGREHKKLSWRLDDRIFQVSHGEIWQSTSHHAHIMVPVLQPPLSSKRQTPPPQILVMRMMRMMRMRGMLVALLCEWAFADVLERDESCEPLEAGHRQVASR